MRYRVYLRGPDDLHYVLVDAEEEIESTDSLNAKAASPDEAFVELGGQTFRTDRVVAVVEEIDWSEEQG